MRKSYTRVKPLKTRYCSHCKIELNDETTWRRKDGYLFSLCKECSNARCALNKCKRNGVEWVKEQLERLNKEREYYLNYLKEFDPV